MILRGRFAALLLSVALLSLSLVAVSAGHAAAATPRFIDLGTLGGANSYATAVNRLGQVVGYSQTQFGEMHAFIYPNPDGSGGMRDLGSPTRCCSYAYGINNNGLVVGQDAGRAFVWTVARGMRTLPAIGAGISSAVDINDRGMIVGNSQVVAGGPTHAVLWIPAPDGSYRITDLGTFPSTTRPLSSFATGVNELGAVVGYAQTDSGAFHAFIAGTGTLRGLIDLGAPPGAGPGFQSFAHEINDQGQVVAFVRSALRGGGPLPAANPAATPFVWQNGKWASLGDLGSGDAAAFDLTNAGLVVGSSRMAFGGASHAVVWVRQATGAYAIRDIGTLGGLASAARGINPLGQIVGESQTVKGATHAFLYVLPGAFA